MHEMRRDREKNDSGVAARDIYFYWFQFWNSTPLKSVSNQSSISFNNPKTFGGHT